MEAGARRESFAKRNPLCHPARVNAPSPSSQTTTPSHLPKQRMAVLFAVMLVAAAGNTAMQSILPALGTRLGIADVLISLAFSWSALLWMITAPRWARVSERRGRKALMVTGISGFSVSMLLCGLALWAGIEGWIGPVLTFVLFSLFRSLYGGFGSAAPPAVQAYVAARTDPAERTKALSLVASSFGLGTVIGPTLAPWLILPVVGLSGPMLMFSLIGVAVIFAIRLGLPDDTPRFPARGVTPYYPAAATAGAAQTLGDDESASAETPEAKRISWFDPRVRNWSIVGLASGHAQAMTLGVIGFLVLDRLALRATPEAAAAPTGHVLWVGAIATLLSQWGLIPMLALRPKAAVVGGGLAAGLGIAALGVARTPENIALAFALASLGFGLLRPGFTSGASLSVPRSQQGAVAGQNASIAGASYVAAPALGVLAYGAAPVTTFVVIGAATILLALWSAWALKDVG